MCLIHLLQIEASCWFDNCSGKQFYPVNGGQKDVNTERLQERLLFKSLYTFWSLKTTGGNGNSLKRPDFQFTVS